ncbi:unnamed protein product [uncultured bacterium]|nr:unnamed protein product [uncultured bacterium]
MTDQKVPIPASAKQSAVDAFFARAKITRARLIFGLDATASRQPTWDTASHLQAEMFAEVSRLGGLDVQLVYYRGHGECQASHWTSDPNELTRIMSKIDCRSGHTQIQRILEHARRENIRQKVHALVFVGDKVEEVPADLYDAASGLGLPAFMFQEGDDKNAGKSLKEIASRTKGAYAAFGENSAKELAELLRAVAAFAVGGVAALADQNSTAAVKLLAQLK